MRGVAAVVLVLSASTAQQPPSFVPVGVVVAPPGRGSGGREDLRTFAKLRFNVAGWRDASGELRVDSLARMLSQGAAGAGAIISGADIEVVPVTDKTSADAVRSRAWLAIARGSRGVMFDGAAALMRNPEALQTAAEFADNVVRNAALFAPLKPRASAGDVRVDARPSDIEARVLESPAALVIVMVNLTPLPQQVKMTFSPEIPEAIWQNMENGGAVNFVAGPDGPTYSRTFPPHDVVVLMIRKGYK
jgi:hypothetical protein